MNINQELERAASNVPNNITPDEVQRAAQYAFSAPTQEDMVSYLMAQRAAQAAAQPTSQEQAAAMAGMPLPAQQAPTPQEQAAVAAQAAPVASQAAQMAAQVQSNTPADTVAQTAPQSDYNQRVNNLVTQAANAGIGQPMSYAERSVLSQILDAKNAYDTAKDDAGRAQAHAAADAYRQAATQYGLNDISAGLNANQLRALLQTDYDIGADSAMQGKTSAEYFDDQYNALRKAGLTRNEATDEAARRAQRYQNERVRNLTNAYYTYGVDRDGSMNNNGAAILNLIYDEQPASAAMGMQNYATPIQGWKFGKNMEAADKAYQQKVDLGQKNFDWNRILNNDKIQAQLKMQANAIAGQLQAAEIQAAATRAAAAARAAATRGGAGGGSSKSSNGGITKSQNGWINKLQTMKRYAYQSLGTPGNPGTMFSDPDDHNVEEYRKALIDFQESGDADENDKAWAAQELENLQKDIEVVSRS